MPRPPLGSPLLAFALPRRCPSVSNDALMREPTEPVPGPSLSELLIAVGARRDVDAFETLFRHFAPRVKAYMSRGGTTGAEELMQETMVTVWNKAALYDASKGAASTWIFAIARNLRVDAYRREKRPEFDPNDPAYVPDAGPSADSMLVASQDANAMRKAILGLPQDQAEVLKMSFYEDRTQSDIAKTLNLPLGTVKSRMRLAFTKLRSTIRASGE